MQTRVSSLLFQVRSIKCSHSCGSKTVLGKSVGDQNNLVIANVTDFLFPQIAETNVKLNRFDW